MQDYIFFWGCGPKSKIQKGCFSQWWPCRFTVDGIEYNCAEQYMMAQKARTFGDEEVFNEILSTNDPKRIKALGRKVRGFDTGVWNGVKYDIVVKGNMEKFGQNPGLKRFLLDTGDATIAEASPKDSIWGIGMAEGDPGVYDESRWRGQNLLGKAIMEVRSRLGSKMVTETNAADLGSESGMYWGRVGLGYQADTANTTVLYPYCLSMQPCRTGFYIKDKNGEAWDGLRPINGVVTIVKVASGNICDLTNAQDLNSIGLSCAVPIFAQGEPYFVFNENPTAKKAGGRDRDDLWPKELQYSMNAVMNLSSGFDGFAKALAKENPAEFSGRCLSAKLAYSSKCGDKTVYDAYIDTFEILNRYSSGNPLINETARQYTYYEPDLKHLETYLNDRKKYFDKDDMMQIRTDGKTIDMLAADGKWYVISDTPQDIAGKRLGKVYKKGKYNGGYVAQASDVDTLQRILFSYIADRGFQGYFALERHRYRQWSRHKGGVGLAAYKTLFLFDAGLASPVCECFPDTYLTLKKMCKTEDLKLTYKIFTEVISKYIMGHDREDIDWKSVASYIKTNIQAPATIQQAGPIQPEQPDKPLQQDAAVDFQAYNVSILTEFGDQQYDFRIELNASIADAEKWLNEYIENIIKKIPAGVFVQAVHSCTDENKGELGIGEIRDMTVSPKELAGNMVVDIQKTGDAYSVQSNNRKYSFPAATDEKTVGKLAADIQDAVFPPAVEQAVQRWLGKRNVNLKKEQTWKMLTRELFGTQALNEALSGKDSAKLRRLMKKGVVEFSYRKKSTGKVRKARGTLKKSELPKYAVDKRPLRTKDDFTYFDVDAGDFRTFKRENFIGFAGGNADAETGDGKETGNKSNTLKRDMKNKQMKESDYIDYLAHMLDECGSGRNDPLNGVENGGPERGKAIAYHVSNVPPEKIKREGFKAGQGNGATGTNLFDDLYAVDYPKNYLFVSKKPWDAGRPEKYRYCYKIDITGMDFYPDFGMLNYFGAYHEEGDDEEGQVFWWKDRDLKSMKNRKLKELVAKQGGQLTTNEMMGGETTDGEYFPYALYDALGSAVVDGDIVNRDHRVIGVEDRTLNEDRCEEVYEPPYTLERIKAEYPAEVYDQLSKCPVHRWRAETGVELIHKEPTAGEFYRILGNWMRMDDVMKAFSDQKSIELFGVDNMTHARQLAKYYDSLN